jgi:hypothetical protein
MSSTGLTYQQSQNPTTDLTKPPSNNPQALTHSTTGHNHVRLSHVQVDILSGITAGIISNIVSHPLDTIKVRMQLNTGHPMKLG